MGWIEDHQGETNGVPVVKTGIWFVDALISFGAMIIVPIGNLIVSLLNMIFPK